MRLNGLEAICVNGVYSGMDFFFSVNAFSSEIANNYFSLASFYY